MNTELNETELFELYYFEPLWDIFLELYNYDYETYTYNIKKKYFTDFYNILLPYIDIKNTLYDNESTDSEEDDEEYILF